MIFPKIKYTRIEEGGWVTDTWMDFDFVVSYFVQKGFKFKVIETKGNRSLEGLKGNEKVVITEFNEF